VYLVNAGEAARQVLVSQVFDKGGPFMLITNVSSR
jgi:hypothetical protein